jgi:hypothetical protein
VQLEWFRQREIKNFKKAYGGGYLGYTKIQDLGSITQFVDTEIINSEGDYRIMSILNPSYLEKLKILSIKLKDYTLEIPEDWTYSILPVLRWETANEKFNSVSISDSIKITRDINTDLIAENLIHDTLNMLREYSLRDLDLNLLILGRPWLNVDEFNFDRFLIRDKLTDVFDTIIEKKISAWSKSLNINNSLDKLKRLKFYLYKDIIMDNYGDLVLDKNNNLIGYKLNENKYCSVYTYQNESNLPSNKVLIRDFDKIKLAFKGEAIDSWFDIRTEFGFIREHNKSKYFYDNNNNFINSEIKFSQPKFSPLKK